jgi:hypothetical protein
VKVHEGLWDRKCTTGPTVKPRLSAKWEKKKRNKAELLTLIVSSQEYNPKTIHNMVAQVMKRCILPGFAGVSVDVCVVRFVGIPGRRRGT